MYGETRFHALFWGRKLSIFIITSFTGDILDAVFDIQARLGDDP